MAADTVLIANFNPATLKQDFEDALDTLTEQFMVYVAGQLEFDNAELKPRIKKMLDYSCKGGKMTRGLTVITATKDVCAATGQDFASKLQKATALGWAIEALQAAFLVADDIMDGSTVRRGAPCWYKLEEVKMDAVNDAWVLESFVFFILRHFCAGTDIYQSVFDLYHEVSLQTQLGQMYDLVSQPQGRKGKEILHTFNLARYKTIVKFKTALYSFYLPVASALILCGVTDLHSLSTAKALCVELGEKFQIEDDYLDCYGDPIKIGKQGTDILDHKCSWLVVQALQLASPAQIEILENHYGTENQAVIKQLYIDLNLEEVYNTQEDQSHAAIVTMINAQCHPHNAASKLPASIFEALLAKIHKRDK